MLVNGEKNIKRFDRDQTFAIIVSRKLKRKEFAK
jgi:hypothetical protein